MHPKAGAALPPYIVLIIRSLSIRKLRANLTFHNANGLK